MDYAATLGYAAAALTVIAFLPQLMRVWRTKQTKDLSLGTYSIFSVGIFLWIMYGVLTNDLPVSIANILIFIQAFIILVFKAKYK